MDNVILKAKFWQITKKVERITMKMCLKKNIFIFFKIINKKNRNKGYELHIFVYFCYVYCISINEKHY